jgi:hypothetical protein
VIEETDASGAMVMQYVWSQGALLQAKTAAETFSCHENAAGSLYAVTDAAGSVVDRMDYDVFGGHAVLTNPGRLTMTSLVPYFFSGARSDPELRFLLAGGAFFEVGAGRFVGREFGFVNFYLPLLGGVCPPAQKDAGGPGGPVIAQAPREDLRTRGKEEGGGQQPPKPPEKDPPEGESPGDEPTFFGKRIEPGPPCLIRIDCKPAFMPLVAYYHCGIYTRMETAQPIGQGFEVSGWSTGSTGSIPERIKAEWIGGEPTSLGNFGFVYPRNEPDEIGSLGYGGPPFSYPTPRLLHRDDKTDCEKVKCLRRGAAQYRRKDPRPYDPWAEDAPNSNSFIGALMRDCNVRSPGDIPGWRDLGWDYWARVRRDWRRHTR